MVKYVSFPGLTIVVTNKIDESYGATLGNFEIYVDHQSTQSLKSRITGRPSYAKPDDKGCFELIRA